MMMRPGASAAAPKKAPNAADVFITAVTQGIAGMQSLLAIMEEETDALTRMDAARLEQTVQRKLAQVRELEKAVTLRERLQKSLGLPSGLTGGNAFVGKAASRPDIQEHWQTYCSLAKQLETRNDMNGQLARQGAQSTRQALGMLTGRQQDDGLYQAGKRRRGMLRGYSLAKA